MLEKNNAVFSKYSPKSKIYDLLQTEVNEQFTQYNSQSTIFYI